MQPTKNHSLVEFCDGSCLAQLSANDMVFPLQYALAYPERWENSFPRLDLAGLGRLDLFPVDATRFPSIELARRALHLGPKGPAVLNAGNEVAVETFLDGEVPLPAIFGLVGRLLDELERDAESGGTLSTLAAALEVDEAARRRSRELLSSGEIVAGLG